MMRPKQQYHGLGICIMQTMSQQRTLKMKLNWLIGRGLGKQEITQGYVTDTGSEYPA
jgi:hypothetical protein